MRTITEKEIEKKVCQYAKDLGWLTYKFASPNNRGVPDRIFIHVGIVMFVEFKRKGKVPTPLQKEIHNDMLNKNIHVCIIDDVGGGKDIITMLTPSVDNFPIKRTSESTIVGLLNQPPKNHRGK